ncbi:uncharacterized protein B0P05DRAFT_291580 [Gilbertella persicaria]|uniref:uncharacterized protein n=1 Tax=Gilbertella persicaria TaxID=101096 RepID=UPI00221F6A5E|nr:uncharacterized protein B0P05DRAFT_291580 [Gilbertella persicaria]KAI8054976.1 hypothetical protein B0P05DRAFT_291580 [Gilbertella persicaria]
MMPHLAFTCDVTCIQHLSYTLADQYELIELDKLDVILNTRLLEIRCIFMLNGLDHLLDSPAWIQQPLNEVMSKCGLSLFNTDSPHIFYYEMKTAFITTPLSYVLDQQAPHGILERFDIIFDYSTNKPKEFQAVWNRKIQTDFMIKYVYDGLNTILVKKTCCAYPFIFSHAYVKKLSNIMSFLPLIAQSLQKSYLTSKATMSVDNHAFSQGFLEKLKTIQTNTAIMNPSTDQDIQEDNISTYLTLGMYHAIKMAHKQGHRNPLVHKRHSMNHPMLFVLLQNYGLLQHQRNE